MAASNNKIVVIGSKMSFLMRALINKLIESGYEAVFAEANVNAINRSVEDACIIAYYLDADENVSIQVTTFLRDKLSEIDRKIVIIGSKADSNRMATSLGKDLILSTFPRPLVVEDFIAYVNNESKRIVTDIKKNILIVDDDPTYMGLIREWLKDKYKVSMASSGMQAILWLTSNKADLILLDYEMPITSGPQVFEMLRSEEATKKIPVIFLTGKSDKQSVMHVVDLKPEGYLLKTIKREELHKKIEEFFLRGTLFK